MLCLFMFEICFFPSRRAVAVLLQGVAEMYVTKATRAATGNQRQIGNSLRLLTISAHRGRVAYRS